MRCPKCGNTNPDNAEICNLCGCALEKPGGNTKTNRLTMASLVRGILKSIVITGGVILIALILGFVAAFFLWRIDAAPIPNDYTIADLRSAPTECATSYKLLMSLAEKEKGLPNAPAIGLSAQDVNTIERINKVIAKEDYSKITEQIKANSDSIYQAWENAQKGRDIISELDTFPEIADLTRIVGITDSEQDTEPKFYSNLRRLVHLYQAYVYLQIEKGSNQTIINELIKLDSVFRKLSINARSTVTKLVCIACLAKNIKTANFIANNPQTSQESLELLAEHFTSFEDKHTSLRNQFIFEYLTFKETLDSLVHDPNLRNSPALKPNSASRLYRNWCNNWIERIGESQESENPQLSVWPAILPDWPPVSIDSGGRVPWFYKVYNPMGSLFVGILMPASERVFEVKTRLEIYHDLLQIVLNKRLDSEASLKARAYSEEYIIDTEAKKIFSPGPDGQTDTKDDIKLTINPDILNATH